MLSRKLTALALLLFSALFSIFSQEILEGNALSESAEAALSRQGFSPLSQELSQTGQDRFAYNLILHFPESAEARAGEGDESGEGGRNEVLFCLTQEDFVAHEGEILDFLAFLRELPRSWATTVLFSALDSPELQHAGQINGTEVFASSVDDADTCCAVAVSFTGGEQTAIFTGSMSRTTPLWLTQRIAEAFFDTQTEFSFEDTLSAIYRLGILRGQRRLAFFFQNDIPAIELHFSAATELSVLKRFAESYTDAGTDEWDMHYLYLGRGSLFRPFFVGERVILLACLSVGLLTILIFCVFSFIGKHGERHKYEFIRSSYMIPLTIALAFLSLFLGQCVAFSLSRAIPLNPIMQYGIKIVFSMLFISALFTVQGIFKVSVTAFMYGYLLSVISIFNIFLFSSRDLTLFVIFAAEYLIIYVSRSAKSQPALIVYFVLMLLPFVPYGYIIIRHAEDAELLRAVFCPPAGNLLLAFGIFPFQITWLRMLVFLNVRVGAKGYTMRKIVLNAAFSTVAILSFVAALIFAVSHFVYRPAIRAAQRVETKIEHDERLTLSARLSKDSFSGMNTNHIRISSKADALRYEVTLRGIGSVHPIYDSIYSYTIETDENGADSYRFIIPDSPPRDITIDYAADAKSTARIEITALYRTDEPHSYRTELRNLKVEP